MFALVGPLDVGALVRGYGVEAVGWRSGGSLGVAGGLIAGVVWVRGVGSLRSLGCAA